MTEIILKWLIPFLCGAAVSGLTYFITYSRKQIKAINGGLQCLLRAEIIRNHDKYMIKKQCPIYAKEALKRAYTAYHALGGNDVATQLYEKVMELPTE